MDVHTFKNLGGRNWEPLASMNFVRGSKLGLFQDR